MVATKMFIIRSLVTGILAASGVGGASRQHESPWKARKCASKRLSNFFTPSCRWLWWWCYTPVIKRSEGSTRRHVHNNRCAILKVYFDQYLEEICASVKTNIRYLRYIYSRVQSEIYFQTDEGLRTEREMTMMLMNSAPPTESGAILDPAGAQQRIGGGLLECDTLHMRL